MDRRQTLLETLEPKLLTQTEHCEKEVFKDFEKLLEDLTGARDSKLIELVQTREALRQEIRAEL